MKICWKIILQLTKYFYTLKDTEIKQIENNIIKENLLWVIQKADGLLFVD